MGRTLGEAWVTILPETAGFRTALEAQVRKSMAGFKPVVDVKVNVTLKNPDTVRFREQLKSQLKNLNAPVTAEVTKTSLAKVKSEIDEAARNRTSKITTTTDADKAAAAYTGWWEKALQKRTLAERAAAQSAADAENRAAAQETAAYTAWWDKAIAKRVLAERAAAAKASDTWMKEYNGKLLGPDAIDPQVMRDLTSVSQRIGTLRKELTGFRIAPDDREAEAQLNTLQAKATVLDRTLGSMTTNVGAGRALVQMAALEAAAAKFRTALSAKTDAAPGLDLTLARSQFTHLEQQANSLGKDIQRALSPSGVTIGTVSKSTFNDLRALNSGVETVRAEIERIKHQGGIVNADDITRVKTLTSGLSSLKSAVAADGVTVSNATASWRGWVNALISIARVQIPLFNGALEKMLPHFLAVASGTHILVEAALEIVAVWVPAAMALTVFSVAAAKTAYQIGVDAHNMNTAAQGTGQAFAGMSATAGKALQNLAKPYVYEAFGLAMIGMQHQAKTTGTVVTTMGRDIDNLFAKAVIAYQHSSGRLALQGSKDFAILADSFKQVGTIIEGFIKITPGYASDLLHLGDAVLHIASAVLNSGIVQGFGKIFLAAHGALFYLGLFATLGSKLGTVLLGPVARISALSGVLGRLGVSAKEGQGKMSGAINAMVTGWSNGTGRIRSVTESASKDIRNGLAVAFTSGGAITAATKLEKEAGGAVGGLGSRVTTVAKGVKGAMAGLFSAVGINPWILAVGAAGFAIYELASKFVLAKDAAQNFGTSASQALSKSTLLNFGNTVAVQVKAAQQNLAALQRQLNSLNEAKQKALESGARSPVGSPKAAEQNTGVMNLQEQILLVSQSVAQYQQVISDLQAKSQTFNKNALHMAMALGLGKGGVAEALDLATQAGIPANDMMSKNATVLAEDTLQVEALFKSYQSLTQGIGGVKTAYAALSIQNSQTMKDAQAVAGAFANYTTLITGGVGAFDTFAQGQTTLNANMKATGAISGTATLTLGKFKDKLALVGQGMDGTSAASVAANQAFLQQVNNAQSLYGQLIQLAAAAGNNATAQHQVSAAGKDMISTLLQTAAGSKSAMTQVYALAQTFGYTGDNKLASLVKWLGGTGNKTTDLQKRVNGLTAAAGNLARAAKALSGQLSGQLNAAMAKSIIDAEGGQAAFDKFAKAVRAYGRSASGTNLKSVLQQGQQLKNVFIQASGSARAAEPALQAYFQQLGVSAPKAKALAMQVLGLSAQVNQSRKPMSAAAVQAQQWATMLHQPIKSIASLRSALGSVDFTKFMHGTGSTNTALHALADGLRLNKSQSQALWAAFAKANLDWLSGKTKTARNEFVSFLVKLGLTVSAANAAWAALSKQTLDATTKKVGLTRAAFDNLAGQLSINKTRASDLWAKLGQNNFSLLDGKVSTNKQKFFELASQLGITKQKTGDLWTEMLSRQVLDIVNGKVKTSRQHFIDLATQLGYTKGKASDLWATLQKAPNVKASVTVAASTKGQVQAVASAPGAAKQTIGRLFFSAQAHGMESGGKVPGWHNTGDNVIASHPSGPIALQGGEAVIPKHLAARPDFMGWAKNNGIPGYASGGVPGTQGLVNTGTAYRNYRTEAANANINFGGDAMKANADAAYNAIISAFGGTGGSAKGAAILADAEKWNHHKYVWGGASNPSTGWDCSSFVGYILGHDFHLPLPGGASWNGSTHGPVASQFNNEPGFHLVSHDVNKIQAGDLLVENSGGHVGFGVGPNRMFSAYGTAFGTIFSDAQKMTNIYRSGGGGGSSTGKAPGALKTGVPLIDKMAADAQGVYAGSSAIAKMFPQLGGAFSGDPSLANAGSMEQNGKIIFDYLRQSMGMTPIAAAGAIASMWGESLWNPEAAGSGGNGLMGWTPARPGIVTGNPTADLRKQLPMIPAFVSQNGDQGVIAAMNRASSVSQAAWLWGRGVERFGIPDVHGQGIALATSIMGGAGATATAGAANAISRVGRGRGHSMGGMIPGFAEGGVIHHLKHAGKKINHLKHHSKGGPNAFGHLDPHMPEWERFTESELHAQVVREQKQAQHYLDLMKYDVKHGNTLKYLQDSGKFKKFNDQMNNSRAALKSRVLFDKESPGQQAAAIAKADKAVAGYYSAQQAKAFSMVNNFGATVANDDKTPKKGRNAAWQKKHDRDVRLYDSALADYMKDGQLSSHWMSLYNQREKQVHALAKKEGGIGPSLRMMKPTNQVMKIAETLMSNPWVGKLIGPASTTPLGWALQPVLGDLMIGAAFNPASWVGKSASNSEYSSVAANWTAAMQSLGGFLQSVPGGRAVQLAGAATRIHGKSDSGKKFFAGGIINERVLGVGTQSGMNYEFGERGAERVTPLSNPGVQNGPDEQTLRLLHAILKAIQTGNNISSQAPNQYARALNQNAGRRVGR